MSVSSSFSIQLLSKIGAPLVAAIEANTPENDEVSVADKMAKMLGLAVEMSIALHGKLDVSEDEKNNENLADETRTALASIAAELIADFYKTNQKIPEDSDKDRMVKSLESVLGFADKFSSSKDQASRLKTLGSNEVLFDETQSQLVALQSMGMIVNAVIEFPFGQSENKLIQEIAESLQKDAENLAKENGTNDKLSELMIFKSLASLYAQCHRRETHKISGGSQDGTPSLDPVWSAYEIRLAMMSALVSGDSGDTSATNNAGGVAPAIPAETPVQTSVATESVTAPVEVEAPSAPAPVGGPMGFFAKKPAGGDATPSAPVVPAAPVEASTEPPKETPPGSVPENTIAMGADPAPQKVEPVVTPPAETPTEEEPKGEAGNPMSFFKGPPKTEE